MPVCSGGSRVNPVLPVLGISSSAHRKPFSACHSRSFPEPGQGRKATARRILKTTNRFFIVRRRADENEPSNCNGELKQFNPANTSRIFPNSGRQQQFFSPLGEHRRT